jgi:hypothetical protein
MGNITIIQGKKPLSIVQGKQPLTIPTEPLELLIVQTMELNYQLSNNQWLFSLNGVTQNVKNLLDSGYTMQVQLIRDRGHRLRTSGSKFRSATSPNYKRPTYPSYISILSSGPVLENKKARISINSFQGSNFVNMNLTNWVNDMFYYNSLHYFLSRNPISRNINDFGYWFIKLGFCILINNEKLAATSPIRLNMGNNKQPINTNYTMTNNIIDIVAL